MKEIAKAISKFHSVCPAVKKDGNNPHFRSKYCTLDSILDTIRKPLVDCGLAFFQSANEKFLCTTVVHIDSGEVIQDWTPLVQDRPGPQALGSSVTYARRYSLGTLLGLCTEDDDDGNNAESGLRPKPAPLPAVKVEAPSTVVVGVEEKPEATPPRPTFRKPAAKKEVANDGLD